MIMKFISKKHEFCSHSLDLQEYLFVLLSEIFDRIIDCIFDFQRSTEHKCRTGKLYVNAQLPAPTGIYSI